MGIASDFALALDPVLFSRAAGLDPDPWQAEALRSTAPRHLWLASRQSGKSTTVATLAAHTATYRASALVLVVSPTERQSAETLLKVRQVLSAVGWPVAAAAEGVTHLELENASRVIALPGSEGSVRGYSSVNMLLLDEAARVSDSLLAAVRPMLAVSAGRLIALSTPAGKRGWFYEAWVSGEPYARVKVRATDVPRIPAAFLAEERRALGPLRYASEYDVEFIDAEGSLFRTEDVQGALEEYPQWNLAKYLKPTPTP
jgi:hypothetical protein